MKFRLNSVAVALRFAIPGAMSAGLVAFGVSAQTPAPQKVEKIEITGSNIKRVDAESAQVVQVITKEEIEKSGMTSLAEVIRSLPAISAGALQDFNTGNGFAAGVNSPSLRGLGSIGTLVLLNGRRVAPSPTADPNTGQGQAYNLNTIPLSAIERIEILKDGASAIYGSDAVAGVINFILRKDYKGGEVSYTGTRTSSNEFPTDTITGTVGFGDLAKDRYNIMISAEGYRRGAEDYNSHNAVQNGAYATLNSRNIATGSSFTSPPNFFRERTLGNGVFNLALATDPRCPTAQVVSANAGCRLNQFDFIQIQAKGERAGFFTKATYDFSATMQGTVELGFTRSKDYFVGSPPTLDGSGPGTYWFSRSGQLFRFLLSLPVGHPDNPFTVPVGLRYRFVDFGRAHNDITNDASRVMAGLTGVWGSWDWQSAFLYNKTERDVNRNGILYYPALLDAVNNRTYRFGGTNSAAVINALNPDLQDKGKTDLTSLDLKGSREVMNLPGGPMALAVGAEIRRESFDINSDPRTVRGDSVGLASTTVGNSRNVQAFYAELLMPVVKSVEVSAAVRHDHYSDYGNSTTPKLGLKWTPTSEFAVRGNYSEAFRAPSLTQASTSRVQSFSTITDPVRCPNGTTPLAGADTIDCTGRTVTSLFLPTAGLQPEKSKSNNMGFIWSPTKDFSFGGERWEIRRRDQIDRFSAQQVINNEFNPAFTGGTVQRDTNPAAQIPGVPNSGPIITTVRRFLNLGETRVQGYDWDLETNWRALEGKFRLKAQATWISKYLYQVDKGGPFVNGAGNFYLFETPKLRANAQLSYNWSSWDVFGRYNYTGGWDYGDPTAANGCYLSATSPILAFMGRCQVRAQRTIDTGVTYSGFKNWTLRVIGNNIVNTKAPYDPGQTTLGFNPTFHNPYGAYFNVSATWRFK